MIQLLERNVLTRLMIERDNVTLLFVTHSTEMAKQFCKRGMVIELGKKVFDGNIEEAAIEYGKIIK